METLEDITRRALELSAQQALEQVKRNREAVDRMAQIYRDQQADREALLTRLIATTVDEVLAHLKTKGIAGDSIVRFNLRRQRRFGVFKYYTVRESQEYASWRLWGKCWGETDLCLTSDGRIGRNRHIAGVWPLDNADYDDKCQVLDGLKGSFAATTKKVIAAELSNPAFDRQFCSDVFGLEPEQLKRELNPRPPATPTRKKTPWWKRRR